MPSSVAGKISFVLRRVAVAWLLIAVGSLGACESPRRPASPQAPQADVVQPGERAPAVTPSPAPASGPAGRPPAIPPGAPVASGGGTVGEKPSLLPYLTGRPSRDASPAYAEPPPAPPRTEGSVRVALLLPLSGPNAALGRAMLNAAQLAVFDWADERFELVVHDVGTTGESAQRAAQNAVADGAGLILGPLLAGSVRAVTPIARAAGVPVVAFSSDRTVAAPGVYIMGFLPDAEVRRVIGYARARGVTRFAALVPDNEYGAAVVSAMRQAAAAAAATVGRVQYYDPNATDFSSVVRQLADYDSRRHALLEQKKVLQARDDEASKRALERLERFHTLGDVPFDALLLPEGGQRLQALAALLPFYDIDPAKVRMLGTGRWDEPGLGAEPALVGGWFAAPSPESRAVFEKRYQEIFKGKPPRLSTLAYDAAALAAVLGKSTGGGDRFSAAALTQPGGFWGSDGIFRLRADGVAERGLAVLQVMPQGTRMISRAPEAFGPATN